MDCIAFPARSQMPGWLNLSPVKSETKPDNPITDGRISGVITYGIPPSHWSNKIAPPKLICGKAYLVPELITSRLNATGPLSYPILSIWKSVLAKRVLQS